MGKENLIFLTLLMQLILNTKLPNSKSDLSLISIIPLKNPNRKLVGFYHLNLVIYKSINQEADYLSNIMIKVFKHSIHYI